MEDIRMNKKIKLIFFFGLLIFLFTNSPQTVKASTNGACGPNLTWTLDDYGVLTVSGTGKMDDYEVVNPNDLYTANRTNSPFMDFIGDIESIIIEDGVTSIGNGAFVYCGNDTIEIAGSVTTIGKEAFIFSRAQKLILHEGIKKIDNDAFNQCEELKSITLPQSLTSMGLTVFLGCSSLEELILSDNLTSFSLSNIEGCTSLKSLTIPEKCTKVEHYILSCQNTHINYYKLDKILVAPGNKQYKSVDGILYTKDGLELVCYPPGKKESFYKIPSEVTSLNDGAFADANYLTKVDIPDGIKTIPEVAFMHSGLISVTIPKSVESIGSAAFDQCRSLETIYILGDISYIEYSVFAFCNSLKEVYFYGSIGSMSPIAFDETTTTIYYPIGDSSWSYIIGNNFYGNLTWKGLFTLAKPENLLVKKDVKGVKITWDKLKNADKYVVYRKMGTDSWVKLKTTTKTTWIDTAANSKGTKYYYRIIAVDGSEKSQLSDYKSIKL